MSFVSPTMEIFFKLPDEIRQQVLYFLSVDDLDLLFLLKLLPDRPHPYLTVRHQALVARYASQDLVMSNFARIELLSIANLKYLIENQILIAARSVSFVLHVTCDTHEDHITSLWRQYLHVLERFAPNFNIRILLRNKLLLLTSRIESWFRPFFNSLSTVNRFTIKYSMGPEYQHHSPPIIATPRSYRDLTTTCPEHLQLQLFHSENLIRHIANLSGCFCCENLKSLDLSFNNIGDEDLRKIYFPPNLEEINLLNNLLLSFTNSTFCFKQLTKVKLLNLSNNNIMNVNLRDQQGQGVFQVLKLDLSGNLLTEYSQIFNCNLFERLRDLDLSNNLLGKLSPFPPSIEILNLCGNYYRLLAELIANVFPGELQLLRLAIPLSEQARVNVIVQGLVKAAKFPNLKELRICGCPGPITNYPMEGT